MVSAPPFAWVLPAPQRLNPVLTAPLFRHAVMSSQHGIPGLLNGVYEEDGPPTDDADIMLTSLPIDLLAEFHVEATKQIAIKDKPLLDDLEKAGFKLNRYPAGLCVALAPLTAQAESLYVF